MQRALEFHSSNRLPPSEQAVQEMRRPLLAVTLLLSPWSPGIVHPKWKLIYEDQFEGDGLNSRVWNVVEEKDVPNRELQTYTSDSFVVPDGALKLTASAKPEGTYQPGKVDTREKLELQYRRVEVRMKLCQGKGLFPAI